MDASYKIQRGIHVHLIQFLMCPESWVHIISATLRFIIMGGNPPLFFGLSGSLRGIPSHRAEQIFYCLPMKILLFEKGLSPLLCL